MFDPIALQRLHTIRTKLDPSGTAWDFSFTMRLSSLFSNIYGIFSELYPQYLSEEALTSLVSRLATIHAFRSSQLRDIDNERMRNPDWYFSQKWVGVMLYADLFANNLSGVKEKLDYLHEIGINVLHLMPLMKCPDDHNDGGYAVSDFQTINPKLGTLSDLKEITHKWKENDALLILDFVMNHTSEEHEWAKKAKAGELKFQKYYHFFPSREEPDAYEKNLPEVFPDTAPGNFTYVPETNSWVMTVFHTYQWDLNYANPEVFEEMLANLLFLSNLGADVIRLDALAFSWKEKGTVSQNLPKAHRLIQLFKACVQVVAPGTLLLAEAIVSPNEIVKYFGKSQHVTNECDLAYNATIMVLCWEAMATKSNRLFYTTWHNIPRKPGGTWLNYIRCHDDIGLGYEDLHASWCGYTPYQHRQFLIQFLTGEIDWSFAKGARFMEDKEKGDARISGTLASLAGLEKALLSQDIHQIDLAISRILLLHSIILSFGGIPMLYSGDEIGQLNAYTFLQDSAKADDNRWMHRPAMNWSAAEKRKTPETIENRIFQGIKHMISVRKRTPVFSDEQPPMLLDVQNEHVLCYKREKGGENSVFCVANLNDHAEPLFIKNLLENGLSSYREIVDILTNSEEGWGHPTYMLKPYQICWLTNK